MPLFREWSINEHCLAAIWEIQEPESFFLERTGLAPDIKNEKKRLEHLAGRFLLKHLKEDFPILNIRPDEHDKPRIENNQYHFSISHSWPYVAVAIDSHADAGIDIQTLRSGIQNIQHKFLSSSEQRLFNNDTQLLTLAWSAKEAVYKWRGKRGVEFIEHIPIVLFEKNTTDYNINIFSKSTNDPRLIYLQSIVNQYFTCAFVSKTEEWTIE